MSVVEWVDPTTGELVDEETPGAVPLEVLSDEEQEDVQRLGDWVSKRLVQIEAQEEAAKRQHERAKKRLAAERKHLEPYLEALKERGRELLTGKRKSVDFAFGRASWRSTKSVVVDEEQALAWAMTNDQAAVKWPEPKLLKSMLSEDCPHRTVKTKESFSVKPAKEPKGGAS